jgi:hypothetical protein
VRAALKDFSIQGPKPATLLTAPVAGAAGQLAPGGAHGAGPLLMQGQQFAPGGGHGQRPTGAPQGDPAPQALAATEAVGSAATATQKRSDTLAIDALFADLVRLQHEQA